MNTDTVLKIFLVTLLSAVIAWAVFSRENSELGYTDRQRYQPYIHGSLLPTVLLFISILAVAFFGVEKAARMTLSMCFPIFLHITVYYAVLLMLLPYLRRHFNARACAMLWMLPNYLYLMYHDFMAPSDPLLVLPASDILVWSLLFIWFAGFVSSLGWKMISHCIFRRRILREASPLNDPDILAVWDAEIKRANFRKAKYPIMQSSQISSPLTIGLFQRKTCVVLPVRGYSREELALIFRHEIIHIGRGDAWSKFFLAFCASICWFHPLMRTAVRKSADDLELSCDETVLMGLDEDKKRYYAELILQTAGDDRGFSTCLSSSASALHYRLKNIVNPPKKRSGALLLGAVFFLLCMSCGYVALSYNNCTGAERIYRSSDTSQFKLQSIYARVSPVHNAYSTPSFLDGTCLNEEALHTYLASLKMTDLTGNYTFSNNQREYCLLFDTPNGILSVCLFDHAIKLVPLDDEKLSAVYYYLPEGMDWNYLDTLILTGDDRDFQY